MGGGDIHRHGRTLKRKGVRKKHLQFRFCGMEKKMPPAFGTAGGIFIAHELRT